MWTDQGKKRCIHLKNHIISFCYKSCFGDPCVTLLIFPTIPERGIIGKQQQIIYIFIGFVTLLCLTFCDPRDCGTVLHHLPELAQTHICWVSDAIQPSCPLSSPSPPAFNIFPIRVFSSEFIVGRPIFLARLFY